MRTVHISQPSSIPGKEIECILDSSLRVRDTRTKKRYKFIKTGNKCEPVPAVPKVVRIVVNLDASVGAIERAIRSNFKQ